MKLRLATVRRIQRGGEDLNLLGRGAVADAATGAGADEDGGTGTRKMTLGW